MELRLRKLENSKARFAKLKSEHDLLLTEKAKVKRQLSELADLDFKLATAAQEKRLAALDVELLEKQLHALRIEEKDFEDQQKSLQMKLMPLKSQANFLKTFKGEDNQQSDDKNLAIKQTYCEHLISQRKQLENDIDAKAAQIEVKKRQLSIQLDAITKLKSSIQTQSLALSTLDSEYMLEKTDLVRWDRLADEISTESLITENSFSLTSSLRIPQKNHLSGNFIRRSNERNITSKKEGAQTAGREIKRRENSPKVGSQA